MKILSQIADLRFPTVLRLLALAPLALLAAGCMTFTPANSDTELVVGVQNNNLPFFSEVGKAPAGLEAELALNLGQRLGQSVRFVPMKARKLLPAVDAGVIDIVMNGVAVTRANSELASFTSPYLKTGQILVVRDADVETRKPAAAIRGSRDRIGVVRDSLDEAYVKAYCPSAQVVSVSTPGKALSALQSGSVDVVVMDAITASVACANVPGVTPIFDPLTTRDVAWAVDSVNFALLDAVNAALAASIQDGTLDAAIKKWIPLYDSLGFDQ